MSKIVLTAREVDALKTALIWAYGVTSTPNHRRLVSALAYEYFNSMTNNYSAWYSVRPVVSTSNLPVTLGLGSPLIHQADNLFVPSRPTRTNGYIYLILNRDNLDALINSTDITTLLPAYRASYSDVVGSFCWDEDRIRKTWYWAFLYLTFSRFPILSDHYREEPVWMTPTLYSSVIKLAYWNSYNADWLFRRSLSEDLAQHPILDMYEKVMYIEMFSALQYDNPPDSLLEPHSPERHSSYLYRYGVPSYFAWLGNPVQRNWMVNSVSRAEALASMESGVAV